MKDPCVRPTAKDSKMVKLCALLLLGLFLWGTEGKQQEHLSAILKWYKRNVTRNVTIIYGAQFTPALAKCPLLDTETAVTAAREKILSQPKCRTHVNIEDVDIDLVIFDKTKDSDNNYLFLFGMDVKMNSSELGSFTLHVNTSALVSGKLIGGHHEWSADMTTVKLELSLKSGLLTIPKLEVDFFLKEMVEQLKDTCKTVLNNTINECNKQSQQYTEPYKVGDTEVHNEVQQVTYGSDKIITDIHEGSVGVMPTNNNGVLGLEITEIPSLNWTVTSSSDKANASKVSEKSKENGGRPRLHRDLKSFSTQSIPSPQPTGNPWAVKEELITIKHNNASFSYRKFLIKTQKLFADLKSAIAGMEKEALCTAEQGYPSQHQMDVMQQIIKGIQPTYPKLLMQEYTFPDELEHVWDQITSRNWAQIRCSD